MAKKKKYKMQMHEIRPGLYRGHAPKNLTPEEKAKLAEEDRKSVELSDWVLENLNRNTKNGRTIF